MTLSDSAISSSIIRKRSRVSGTWMKTALLLSTFLLVSAAQASAIFSAASASDEDTLSGPLDALRNLLGSFMLGACLAAGFLMMGAAGTANAVIIDFDGGTAYPIGGGAPIPITNTGLAVGGIDYYIEDGVRIDFNGGNGGWVGDYYNTTPGNGVIHAHWDELTSITFSMVDNSLFDLNYMDLTSNTAVGGGHQNGTEISHVTSANGSMLLPSSDWGFDFTFFGAPGDGVATLWMNNDFDQIASFIVSSQNADCFGMDNFYINEAPPPIVGPEPSTALLVGLGLVVMTSTRRRA